MVTDSQHSSKRFRKKAADNRVEAVIPYPANQRPREKGLLHEDKNSRTHDLILERRTYRRRASVELTNLRLGSLLT